MFSEQEIFAILKRQLPQASSRDLENVAESIVNTTKSTWEEIKLHEDVHDKEAALLKEICQRKSKQEPSDIKIFYKTKK